MIIIGIDPGLDGAFSIFANKRCILAQKTLFLDGELCMANVSDALEAATLYIKPDLVICEKVHSTPNDGHVGAFTFGMGYGHIKGFCEGRGWPLVLVTPAKWKTTVLKGKMGLTAQAIKYLQQHYPAYNPKKKALNKATTLAHVHEKYPDINLLPGRSRLPQDGIADAVCLGEFGAIHV